MNPTKQVFTVFNVSEIGINGKNNTNIFAQKYHYNMFHDVKIYIK
jgi:hypothetical protein